jgi:hypothetical protein
MTRGGRPSSSSSYGHKQEAAYAQDNITFGNATATLGVRFDNYNGITSGDFSAASWYFLPIKSTATVLRGSFTRNRNSV